MKRYYHLQFLALVFLVSALSSCSLNQVRPEQQSLATPKRDPTFVSKRASEAILSFSHRVLIQAATKPTLGIAKEQVFQQIQHLFGPMERAEYSGVPKEDHKVTITSIKASAKEGVYEINYDYSGTSVIENGPRKYFDVYLPNNPDLIYSASMIGSTNTCTDEHYQSEGDFWYFWSPAPTYPECKLKEGRDFEVVHANIERIKPDAKTTYPEYHRLMQDGVINIHFLFGLDNPTHGHNPNTSNDINADAYKKVREELIQMGYSLRRVELSEIHKVVQTIDEKQVPFVEELSKNFPSKNLTVRVRLFFGETGITENSRTFHFFLRDALENASVMIYGGHSGLGGHLDLDSIQKIRQFKIKPPKDTYQIYFFNSCTSYTYYNAMYFQRKRKNGNVDAKGTKNLDILANGLSTAFDAMASGDMAVIRAIDLWASHSVWTSYQKIARSVDSDNLFTVNGDEDNPTEPVKMH